MVLHPPLDYCPSALANLVLSLRFKVKRLQPVGVGEGVHRLARRISSLRYRTGGQFRLRSNTSSQSVRFGSRASSIRLLIQALMFGLALALISAFARRSRMVIVSVIREK